MSAPAVEKRKRANWRPLVFAALLFATFTYGWQITKIDLVTLFTGLPKMQHIVAGLLQPDVLTRAREKVQLQTPFGIGCAETAPATVRAASRAMEITLNQACA